MVPLRQTLAGLDTVSPLEICLEDFRYEIERKEVASKTRQLKQEPRRPYQEEAQGEKSVCERWPLLVFMCLESS